jgi:hypothetical protein
MIERFLPGRARASLGWLAGAVAVVIACWILGNPRSSGPDEASHMVASAGLVRGDRDGDPNPTDSAYRLFELPGMVGQPDPTCWASTFDPNVPVACQDTIALTTDERLAATTSAGYPPYGFVLPGLASYVPWAGGYAYLARALDALVPVLLLGAALAALASQRATAAAAAVLGLTPIAWFTFGIVNPSAPAIAGGLALWTGLLHPSARRADWLVVAGWAAVLLPRRDGPLWAALIVLACCWITTTRPSELWARLGAGQRRVAGIVTVLPVLTPLLNGERGFNLALSVAPVGIVAVEALARWYDRLPSVEMQRALVGYSVAGTALVAAAATMLRPGGFRAETLRLVVANTGDHLRQLVGVLGWLSTPVPFPVVFLHWAVIGGLATVAYLERRRVARIGVIALLVAIVVAWLLELGQGADYGDYWQGRYTMPFAVGLPLVLVWRAEGDRRSSALVDQVTPVVVGAAWLISNVAFVAAQQRWAVGINGSWYPWQWNTWSAPVWPAVLVLVHAVATAALAALVSQAAAHRDDPVGVAA